MKPLVPIFVSAGLVLASLGMYAEPTHHLQPLAPRTVSVSESQTPPVIRAGLLQSTLIVLPAEEKVANVFAGDTVDWVFDGGHVASRFVSVKPRVANGSTDVHIVSDHGNEYTLQLREVSGDDDPHFDSKILIDPTDKAAKEKLAQLPEAAQRKAEHEQRMAEYQAEQQRKEDERKAEFERQQKEYEAEQARRDKLRKARVSTLERIIEAAPTSFSAEQTRMFLRLLIHINPYDFLENVASYFTSDDENAQQSDDEVLLAALGNTADEKLNGLALRIVLTDHVGIPHENQPDLLTETETVFDPKKPKAEKDAGTKKAKSTGIKAAPKKTATAKKAA